MMVDYPRTARIREQIATNAVDPVWARADLDYLLSELDIANVKIEYLLSTLESPDMDDKEVRNQLEQLTRKRTNTSGKTGIAGVLAYDFDAALGRTHE